MDKEINTNTKPMLKTIGSKPLQDKLSITKIPILSIHNYAEK